MTKHPSTRSPLPAKDFTLELFCRVDDALRDQTKPALARLHPSEVVTIGLLYGLRGQGFLAFYRWLKKELGACFPGLVEVTRLFRLLSKYEHLTQRFLAQETTLGVCDTLGIELLHPIREGRCEWHFARKGRCNHRSSETLRRWIVGAKFFVLLNAWGQIVRWSCCGANLHDTVFHCLIEDFEDTMIVLADSGFHAKAGDPKNLKLCKRGTWNERMLIETAFSLFEGVLKIKKQDHRLKHTLWTRLAYCAAVYNLCINWTGQVQLSLKNFAL